MKIRESLLLFNECNRLHFHINNRSVGGTGLDGSDFINNLHTGNYLATICSVEALDLCLKRILDTVDKLGGVALITADHGNADEMAELDKKTKAPKTNADGSYKAKTSHTLNPVPCILYDASGEGKLALKADDGSFGLSNVAATVVNLLGYEAPEMWDSSLIEIK